jgi:uncharacterized protein (TIGR02757 family)
MSLKDILNKLYNEYDFKERIKADPIEFPHSYTRTEDIETSGFISASFAYGKVDLFKPIIKRVLTIMGESPYEFLMTFDLKKRGYFKDIFYRFNKADDIVCLIFVLSEILKKHKSLQSLFMTFYSPDHIDIGEALKSFINAFLNFDTSAVYGKNIKTSGFLQFFPSPKKGSACKRMNLFLRWMVRDRDIDFGLWKGVPKNKLIIPLDAHIARISRCLRLTGRKSQDWKMAVEITESLKKLDPEDPLKYDFALCHQGISKICSDNRCMDCGLLNHSIPKPDYPICS